MKKALIIFVCLISFPAYSGISSSSSISIEDLDAFLVDLAERSKIKPSDSFQVYSERNWVGEELEKVRRLKSTYKEKGVDYNDRYDELIKKWREIKEKTTSFNDDISAINEFIKSDFVEFLNLYSIFISIYDLEGIALSNNAYRFWREGPLGSVVNSDKKLPITTKNVDEVLVYLKDTLRPNIDKTISDSDKELKERIAKYKLTAEKLNNVEQKLREYRKSLSEIATKADTKDSLKSNLYLMILVIGGLSIAAIALVRWFPESVMLEWVESGQVIQFVTVMILLSVIMALGLAGLLTENTLGTLLGGIGGYVLSQGVGRSAARAALKEHKAELANKKKQPYT